MTPMIPSQLKILYYYMVLRISRKDTIIVWVEKNWHKFPGEFLKLVLGGIQSQAGHSLNNLLWLNLFIAGKFGLVDFLSNLCLSAFL